MKHLAIAVVCLLPAVSIGAGIEDCICRAKNTIAIEGEIVCLTTPNGPKLARCEKVLNNTSWKFLPESCAEQVTGLFGPQFSQAPDNPPSVLNAK